MRQPTSPRPEGFAFEALEEFFELRFARLRQHQAAFGGFAVVNFVKVAEFANAVDMAEEINDEEFICGEGGKYGGPNDGCVLAAHRLAAFRSEQLKSDGLNIGTKVESFHIKGERRQL